MCFISKILIFYIIDLRSRSEYSLASKPHCIQVELFSPWYISNKYVAWIHSGIANIYVPRNMIQTTRSGVTPSDHSPNESQSVIVRFPLYHASLIYSFVFLKRRKGHVCLTFSSSAGTQCFTPAAFDVTPSWRSAPFLFHAARLTQTSLPATWRAVPIGYETGLYTSICVCIYLSIWKPVIWGLSRQNNKGEFTPLLLLIVNTKKKKKESFADAKQRLKILLHVLFPWYYHEFMRE